MKLMTDEEIDDTIQELVNWCPVPVPIKELEQDKLADQAKLANALQSIIDKAKQQGELMVKFFDGTYKWIKFDKQNMGKQIQSLLSDIKELKLTKVSI